MFISKARFVSWGETVWAGIGWLIFWVIFGVAWLLLGSTIAIPYTMAANGNEDHFVTTAMFIPFAVVPLFIAWAVGRVVGRDGGWFSRYWFVGLMALWLTLPIWCNLGSIVLRGIGLEATAQVVFNVRYSSIGAAVLAVMFVFIVSGVVGSAIEWWQDRLRKHWRNELRWVEQSIGEVRTEIDSLVEIATRTARESVGRNDFTRDERQRARSDSVRGAREHLRRLTGQRHRLMRKLGQPVNGEA